MVGGGGQEFAIGGGRALAELPVAVRELLPGRAALHILTLGALSMPASNGQISTMRSKISAVSTPKEARDDAVFLHFSISARITHF